MNINKILDIIAWTLIILGIIFLYWKLIGGSPMEFNILAIFLGGTLFKVIRIGNDVSALKEKINNIDNKHNELSSDFKELTKQFNILYSRFEEHIKHG